MTEHRYLAIDRSNLFSWLSRGLIVPRALMDKYRPDALEITSSRLPLATDRAVGLLSASAEYPVCVELASQVDTTATLGETDSAIAWTRGALSTRRIARVHVRTDEDIDEMRAREYRGFDAGDLDLVVSPALFAVSEAVADQHRAMVDNDPPDDRILKRREAVAGAVMSMFSGQTQTVKFPDEWITDDLTEDPIRTLARVSQSSGLITKQDDFDLLHGTLVAIYDQSEQGDIVASTLLGRIVETMADSRVAGIDRHLERIRELTRGEDELRPFRTQGGLLTTKALLLYLLRPDPEAVRGWAGEDLNAESEVLQLSRLLAGLSSRYGGLPSSLRIGGSVDALLDWTARGLQPSDFTVSNETKQGTTTATDAPATGANPSADALRGDVAAGEYDQALAVAQQLGWDDCLQLTVTADSFETGTTGRQVRVTFAPGAVPSWSLLPEPFIDRLSGLSDANLQAALETNHVASHQTPAKVRRNTARARSKNLHSKPGDSD